jgi:hypothetical protein
MVTAAVVGFPMTVVAGAGGHGLLCQRTGGKRQPRAAEPHQRQTQKNVNGNLHKFQLLINLNRFYKNQVP